VGIDCEVAVAGSCEPDRLIEGVGVVDFDHWTPLLRTIINSNSKRRSIIRQYYS
jgi:hypothetical protein